MTVSHRLEVIHSRCKAVVSVFNSQAQFAQKPVFTIQFLTVLHCNMYNSFHSAIQNCIFFTRVWLCTGNVEVQYG